MEKMEWGLASEKEDRKGHFTEACINLLPTEGKRKSKESGMGV